MNKPELKEGEIYAGAIINPDGTGNRIILLPEDKDEIKWQDAMQWAESIGGHLPDRVEQALLFKCLKDEFEEEVYWSCEESTSSTELAWYQSFFSGIQSSNGKDFKLSARAVRRVEIK